MMEQVNAACMDGMKKNLTCVKLMQANINNVVSVLVMSPFFYVTIAMAPPLCFWSKNHGAIARHSDNFSHGIVANLLSFHCHFSLHSFKHNLLSVTSLSVVLPSKFT